MDKAWQAQFAPWINRIGNVQRLITRTADGIELMPLYGQTRGLRAERSALKPWTVFQRIDSKSGSRANAQILEDLEGGTDGLCIALPEHELPVALRDVHLHAISIRIEGGEELARAFAQYVARRPIDPSRLNVSFCLKTSGLAQELLKQGFAGPFIEADGRPRHCEGASEAQELGVVLHELVAALRLLEKPVRVGATLAANQDIFVTLAKFRSLRLLWARVLEASDIAFAPLRIHAETSRRMMAALDSHMNILRATASVFGAGLGGADSICVLPFSAAQGLPDAHARRVARNTQLMLLEESHLWRVTDPASGSGCVEALTHELCERAWTVFQEIERTGSIPAFNDSNPMSDPIIGVTSHRLAREFSAAIEADP
jgi:methylmalonyl-CoA mutase